MRNALAAGAVAALLVARAASGQPQQQPTVDELLGRATSYMLDLLPKLSEVVAEERYIQDSSVALATVPIPGLSGRGTAMQPRGNTAKHRELKSDFLIVKHGPDFWDPFRDVFEVDGIKVRDREERLAKLFMSPETDARVRASEIADESARYNLGAVKRTINNPVFGLIFLEPQFRSRLRFAVGRSDRHFGDDVSVVEFREESRPTIINGQPGQDMPAFGRFWIEEQTGRVLKTEVRVDRTDIKATLTTVFRSDERLGIDVPSEMREDYELSGSHVTGVATYSRFRRFQVESSEELVTK